MERVASAFVSAHSLPGLSVAVARNGELLYERGFGFADRDKNERVTPAHLFRIASVSKPITSVTLFRLMDWGSDGPDDVGPGAPGKPLEGVKLVCIPVRCILRE